MHKYTNLCFDDLSIAVDEVAFFHSQDHATISIAKYGAPYHALYLCYINYFLLLLLHLADAVEIYNKANV